MEREEMPNTNFPLVFSDSWWVEKRRFVTRWALVQTQRFKKKTKKKGRRNYNDGKSLNASLFLHNYFDLLRKGKEENGSYCWRIQQLEEGIKSTRYHVTKNPLRRRLGFDRKKLTGKQRGFCERQVWTNVEENEFVVWLKARQLSKMPPTFKLFQRIVKGHVANSNFKGGFNWLLNFCNRYKVNNITLKKTEIETVSRAQAKTEVVRIILEF